MLRKFRAYIWIEMVLAFVFAFSTMWGITWTRTGTWTLIIFITVTWAVLRLFCRSCCWTKASTITLPIQRCLFVLFFFLKKKKAEDREKTINSLTYSFSQFYFEQKWKNKTDSDQTNKQRKKTIKYFSLSCLFMLAKDKRQQEQNSNVGF